MTILKSSSKSTAAAQLSSVGYGIFGQVINRVGKITDGHGFWETDRVVLAYMMYCSSFLRVRCMLVIKKDGVLK